MKQLSLLIVLLLGAQSYAAELELKATQSGRMLVIDVQGDTSISSDHLLVFLDTDSNKTTGYAPSASPTLGFNHLIQGENLFVFNSKDRGVWEWKPIGAVQRQVNGRQLRIRMDVDQLESSKVGVAAWLMVDDWSDVLKMQPVNDVLSTTIDLNRWPIEAANDSNDASMDLKAVSTSEKDGKLSISLETKAASDFATTLVFLDTDFDSKTGYTPPARPAGGFELLVQNDGLYRHNSDTRNEWQWQRIGAVERSNSGNQMALSLDASQLRTKRLRFVVMMMSADWQQVRDAAPDHGLYRINIKTKSAPQAKKPPLAPAKANRHLSARQRVAQAKTYSCYYGRKEVGRLSAHDLVILEDRNRKPEQDVKPLQERGVVAVAYISVGEDTEVREGATWYFDRDKDGKPDRNKVWNSWFADAADPSWRNDRLNEARRLIEGRGYDGLFLDTVDTAALYPNSLEGMVELIHQFREQFPDAVIVVNQGLGFIGRYAPYVDAVMIESFTLSYNFDDRTYFVRNPSSLDHSFRRITRDLLPALKSHPLKVLVLDYCGPNDLDAMQIGIDRATTFGFLWSASPIALDMVYDAKLTGTPNDKWKQRQATPESMRYTMAKAGNGFPAGTVITPSSTFGGYAVTPIVDGIANRADIPWNKAAWASGEYHEDHWLTFDLPKSIKASKLQVTFALDNGNWYASRKYQVQVRAEKTQPWHTVAERTGNTSSVVEHQLPGQSIQSIRIFQPEGGGHAERPHLMWIGQVQIEH